MRESPTRAIGSQPIANQRHTRRAALARSTSGVMLDGFEQSSQLRERSVGLQPTRAPRIRRV